VLNLFFAMLFLDMVVDLFVPIAFVWIFFRGTRGGWSN
jgi:hypothetical protein